MTNFSYTVIGLYRFEAAATDADGSVIRVEFWESETNLLGETYTSPYRVWLTNYFATGSYVVVAKAFDNSGSFNTSDPVPFVVVQDPYPSPVIVSPADGVVLGPNDPIMFSVRLDGSDDSDHSSVEFFVDGVSVALDTTFPYGVELNNLSLGPHTLITTGTNQYGNTLQHLPVHITIMMLGLSNPMLNENDTFGFFLEGEPLDFTSIIMISSDLIEWQPLLTNRVTTTPFLVTDTSLVTNGSRYYRALVAGSK